jgi:hypothetical protein
MTTIHDPLDFVAGDTWTIDGALTDVGGNPLVLAGASIEWRLDSIDATKNILAMYNDTNGGIQILYSAGGSILITVPAAQTATVPAGNYSDWLRVTLADGTTLTEWTGVIRVAPNPS